MQFEDIIRKSIKNFKEGIMPENTLKVLEEEGREMKYTPEFFAEFEKDILKPKDKKSKKKSSKKEKVEMNEGGTTMDTVMAVTNALGAYGEETSKPNSDPLDESKFVTPEPPRRR